MTVSPYLQGYEPNVHFQTIATAGDTVDTKADGSAYRMVGIPDGLGAFDNGDGTITLVMNHEIGFAGSPAAPLGIVRDHGGKGAFVSEWTLNKSDLSIVNVEDAIKHVFLFDDATEKFVENTSYSMNRLCSADMAPTSAYYWVDPVSGVAYGTQSHIFMTGEESGTEGKEFAVFIDGPDAGKAYEFADCGLFAWENNLASPYAQLKTITICQDDGQNGQVYVYVGEKQATGSEFQKAGLEDGHLFGIKVTNLVNATPALSNESDGAAASGRFTMYDEGVVGALTGVQLDAQGEANGVTSFQRPEDGHWDTLNPNVYWFVTTASATGQSRLYKLTFDDITRPEDGGSIEAVLSSSDLPVNGDIGPRMMDNITVTANGHVLIEEDIGNNAFIGRILDYDPVADTVTVVAQHNPAQFVPGGANFITQDEEGSGIIDVTALLGYSGGSVYLTSDQIHKAADAELVEGGQFVAMYVDDVKSTGTKVAETLNGSAASETFAGKGGNDVINAGSGNDSVQGGAGNDTLNGMAGDDTLRGDGGNDSLYGGAGADELVGGAGDDVLVGGLGKDLLKGNEGADTFVFAAADSVVGSFDRIQNFVSSEGDVIDLTQLHTSAAYVSITDMGHNLFVVAADIDHNGSFEFGVEVFTRSGVSMADLHL